MNVMSAVNAMSVVNAMNVVLPIPTREAAREQLVHSLMSASTSERREWLLAEGIVCVYHGTRPLTNVPVQHRHHSPRGRLNWGRLGRGAADLALNVLSVYCPASNDVVLLRDGSRISRIAFDLHQDFLKDVITRIDYEVGGKVARHEIVLWLAARRVIIHEAALASREAS
jgi:hypothetical protein